MYTKDYIVYKPRKTNNGAASSWSLNVEKQSLFLEMSQQFSDGVKREDKKVFDWDNKAIMKLGIADIGSLISVFEKREPVAKLFHEHPNGTDNSSLKVDTNNDRGGWFVTMGVKKGGGDVRQISHSLTFAEGTILLVLLKQAVLRFYGW